LAQTTAQTPDPYAGLKLRYRLLPPWLALGIIIALHVLALPFLFKIHFNNIPEVFSPEDSPALQFRRQLLKEFPTDESLVALFEGDDLYQPQFLAALHRVSVRLEKHPLIDRVMAVINQEHIAATDDGFAVEPLIDPDDIESRTPKEWLDRVKADRFAPGLLASKDGKALALAVRPKPVEEGLARREVELAVRDAIHAEKLDGQLTAVAGQVAVTVGQLESIWRDSARFIPLTVGIGLLLLWWVVGRIRPVVIGALAMSTVVSVSVAGLVISGRPYTPISAMIPTLMAAYTTATLLHFYAAVQRARVALLPRPQRIDRALSETLKPGIFNVLTTAAGLISLTLAPIPPVQTFGLAGALGTVTVFLVVYGLIPPMLLKWDVPRWPRRRSGLGKFRHAAAFLTFTSLRHPAWVLAVTFSLVLAGIPAMMRIHVESDLLKFFSPRHPITLGTERVETRLSGVTPLEIVITGQKRDSLKEPGQLNAIRALQTWLETLPEVDRTVSLPEMLEEMNWAFNGEDEGFRVIPDSRKLVHQYLLIYDGDDLYEIANREFDRTRLLISLNVHGANEISRVMDIIRAHLEQHPLPALQWRFSGFGDLFAEQENMIVEGQILSFFTAFGQIALLMFLLWRSVRAAVICLIPNLTPLFFVFVVMGLTGISLDVATMMIAGVVLGITMDDTIHLYHAYRHRLQQGRSPVFAIARSFEASGRAVMAISLVLVAQFSLLAFSDFRPTANFGLLCAVGLLSGQFFELMLLPALLGLQQRSRT
jgi:uncharacterized protein